MSVTQDDAVEAKLEHMIECLREYAVEVKQYNFESAHEAADQIGSEDGEGCEICEKLSTSLTASLAYAMWFPDDDVRDEIVASAAGRADQYADDLEDELNSS